MVHVTKVGDRTLVGHRVVLNAGVVGNRCLIGSGAVLNQSVEVGDRCIVAAGAVGPDRHRISGESFVRSVPAEVTPLSEASIDHEAVFKLYSTTVYDDFTARYDDLFEAGSDLGA